MEIYESLGIANDLREESKKYCITRFASNVTRYYSVDGPVLAMETLVSPTPLATYAPTLNDGAERFSSAKRTFLTQRMVIRILRQHVESLPLINLHYECGVAELRQDDNRVIATTPRGRIIAKYCIGCDGPRGITRKVVTGEAVSGRGLLNNSLTIIFRVIPSLLRLISGGP
jgi:2-polyprenyl-6-methoxyphenol hydroxylase-like FAD-dependent oxidoreductase